MSRLSILALTVCLSQAAAAETFRCGQWIASPDMTVGELAEKCGPPTSKTVEVVDVYAQTAAGGRIKTGTSTIETWIYGRGSRAFDMIVTIVDGEIKGIKRGDY